MIEQEFTGPILGQFSRSQSNSVDSEREEGQMELRVDAPEGKRNRCLGDSDDSVVEIEENRIRNRRSTKRHSVGGKRNCQSTTVENSSEAISINESESNLRSQINRNGEIEETYECANCVLHPQADCMICHGKTTVTQSDSIVKFFLYVLEFKIGKKGNYIPNSCKNTITMTQSTNFQTRKSLTITKSNRIQLQQKLAQIKNIHYDYYCDLCKKDAKDDPIQGKRFHCSTCADFDLCQACFQKHNHDHTMDIINYSNSYKHRISTLFHLINDQERMRSGIKCSIAAKPKIHQSSIR